MQTTIKRRYKDRQPEYPAYTKAFDHALLGSNILNSDEIPNSRMTFWDRKSTEASIEELSTIIIPQRELQLQEILEQWEDHCGSKARQGFERPEQWPKELLEKRLRAEALLDINKRELEFLQDRLQHLYEEPEKQREEQNVLAFGPVGRGRLNKGVLIELDGQRVEMINEFLVITSPSSPYRGMSVPDYRKFISEPWVKERNDRMREAERVRKAEIAEKGFSKTIIPTYGKRIDKSSLPGWPEGVQNYLENDEADQRI